MKILSSNAYLRSSAFLLVVASQSALATEWITTENYNGFTTTIAFDDWGYTGPMGVGANDFQVNGGFDASRLGQIQSVTTVAPDYRTNDPTHDLYTDFGTTPYGPGVSLTDANMDGSVNFYGWGYTTPTSTFSNMQIDKAGNYFVAKDDMNFGFYDTFDYRNDGAENTAIPGSTTGSVTSIDTGINFQPYAISDAMGWCGSTMISNPNGLDEMAGQVTFDFAFDAYLNDGSSGTPLTQIVPDFVMRSYGSYVVTSQGATNTSVYTGSAVGNNINPETGELDPDYLNKVSFLGGGVVPDGVWVINDGTPDVEVVAEGTPGAVWHKNLFGGYAFLLRADAERTLKWIAPDGHSDYVATDPLAYESISAVPVPAAAWLFGSGLIGLIGLARRKNSN